MAKLKSPLLSFSAHGTILKHATYRFSNGLNIVSGFSKPSSYRKFSPSQLQLNQRSLYSSGVVAWNSLTSNEKDVYNNRAISLDLTGFNLFMKEYLFVPPTISYFLLETGDKFLLETGDDLLLQ